MERIIGLNEKEIPEPCYIVYPACKPNEKNKRDAIEVKWVGLKKEFSGGMKEFGWWNNFGLGRSSVDKTILNLSLLIAQLKLEHLVEAEIGFPIIINPTKLSASKIPPLRSDKICGIYAEIEKISAFRYKKPQDYLRDIDEKTVRRQLGVVGWDLDNLVTRLRHYFIIE